MKEKIEEAARDYATCEVGCGGLKGVRGIDGSKVEPFIAGAEWMQKLLGWVSVKERMPEIRKPVLFITEHGNIINGYHDERCWWEADGFLTCWYHGEPNYSSYCQIHGEVNITHWMPIPELPKGGEE